VNSKKRPKEPAVFTKENKTYRSRWKPGRNWIITVFLNGCDSGFKNIGRIGTLEGPLRGNSFTLFSQLRCASVHTMLFASVRPHRRGRIFAVCTRISVSFLSGSHRKFWWVNHVELLVELEWLKSVHNWVWNEGLGFPQLLMQVRFCEKKALDLILMHSFGVKL
jgi:hypothetical protein